MNRIEREVEIWIQTSLSRLEQGLLRSFDFDVLRYLVQNNSRVSRQQILYLYARDPNINSDIIAWSDPEIPDPHSHPQEPPYPTIKAAVNDNWQIIQFPQLSESYNDIDTHLIGHEFILQK